MSNLFFDAIMKETDPMYDAVIMDENSVQRWKNPVSHNANNGHSTTKLFVATAIGILCDRGMMSVDDKATKFFTKEEMGDTLDERWNNVTVKDILRHKTGMEHIPYGVDEDGDIEKIGSDFLKYVFSIKIEQKTGEFYKYSDAAYYLLGRIISKVSGMNAIIFMRENIFKPLSFAQWAMATCPEGYPICGGGFFSRSEDSAKLGLAYACEGVYNGKKIISREWIENAKKEDFACTQFRDTGIFLKTGARGQCIAFSPEKRVAAAWHGCSAPDDNGKRNDRLLSAFDSYLKSI